MKRIALLLVFFGMASICYSQVNRVNIGRFVNEAVSTISKPVPNNYVRRDRTTFLNEDGIIVAKVFNGVIIGSAIGQTFDRTNEALEWQSQFYDFFENNNWNYSNLSERGVEIYIKNNIYALILSPSRRDDNQIVAMVIFVDSLNNLEHF